VDFPGPVPVRLDEPAGSRVKRMTDQPSLDVDFARAHFPPCSNGWAFFENAGGTYVPQSVIDRTSAYMATRQVQIGASFEASAGATRDLDTAQQALAHLFNADPSDFLIGPSTTVNIYVLAQALRPLFQPGDEILISTQNHEANIGAWARLEELGLKVLFWDIDPETGCFAPNDLDALLTERTKLVCVPHASNIIGMENDIHQIVARAHANDTMVCVDGVAYAPHRHVDLKALGADFYVLSLYKVFGPHLSLMYVDEKHQNRLANQNHYFLQNAGGLARIAPGGMCHELVAGSKGITDYFQSLYESQFDNKTAFDGSALYELFEAQENKLGAKFHDFLRSKNSVRLLGPPHYDPSRLPIFSFTSDRSTNAAIVAAAEDAKVAIRSGHFYAKRCLEAVGIAPDEGVVRTSMIHYNTDAEVDRLVQALDPVL